MSNNEVSVKYEPFKEIIIMEKTPFATPENLARFTSVIAGGKLAGLYWAEGKGLLDLFGLLIHAKVCYNHRNKGKDDRASNRHII